MSQNYTLKAVTHQELAPMKANCVVASCRLCLGQKGALALNTTERLVRYSEQPIRAIPLTMAIQHAESDKLLLA